jgi:hypothetical protein
MGKPGRCLKHEDCAGCGQLTEWYAQNEREAGRREGVRQSSEDIAQWLEARGYRRLASDLRDLSERAANLPTPSPRAAEPLSEAIRAMPAQPAKEFRAIDEEAELPYHLREDSPPLLVCSHCGRKSWGEDTAGGRCGMRQPNGYLCAGWWRRP